jgi:serine/threonine protein kinase
VGTVDYLAPEILKWHHVVLERAEREDVLMTLEDGGEEVQETYGPEVDWWSLGATLYEVRDDVDDVMLIVS